MRCDPVRHKKRAGCDPGPCELTQERENREKQDVRDDESWADELHRPTHMRLPPMKMYEVDVLMRSLLEGKKGTGGTEPPARTDPRRPPRLHRTRRARARSREPGRRPRDGRPGRPRWPPDPRGPESPTP